MSLSDRRVVKAFALMPIIQRALPYLAQAARKAIPFLAERAVNYLDKYDTKHAQSDIPNEE